MALKSLPCHPLTRAREIFADLLARDVLDSGAYDAEVRKNPRNYAIQLTDGLSLAEVRQLTNDLRAERRRVAKLSREPGDRWDGLS